ncbi:hypothetical protein Bbelb_277690, partial [Branchiostoma belcheri]
DDLDDITNRSDIKKYMRNADDKVAAAKAIYNKMVSMGKAKAAERFQKRAKAYIRRSRRKEKGIA